MSAIRLASAQASGSVALPLREKVPADRPFGTASLTLAPLDLEHLGAHEPGTSLAVDDLADAQHAGDVLAVEADHRQHLIGERSPQQMDRYLDPLSGFNDAHLLLCFSLISLAVGVTGAPPAIKIPTEFANSEIPDNSIKGKRSFERPASRRLAITATTVTAIALK